MSIVDSCSFTNDAYVEGSGVFCSPLGIPVGLTLVLRNPQESLGLNLKITKMHFLMEIPEESSGLEPK